MKRFFLHHQGTKFTKGFLFFRFFSLCSSCALWLYKYLILHHEDTKFTTGPAIYYSMRNFLICQVFKGLEQ